MALGRNAAVFICAQFGSRFANSFLGTAVRFELLEIGGVAKFASAQVATQIARTFLGQLSGVLTDNYPLKKLYVFTEAANVLLVLALLPATFGVGFGPALYIANIGIGLILAFSQPVAKSLPPAVVAPEDLAIVNSWDLTGDKIARYLAPLAFTVFSSIAGFQAAVAFTLVMYIAIVSMKQMLIVSDKDVDTRKGGSDKTAKERLLKVFTQVWQGILSLKDDRTIGLLILNTLLTNMLLYPLNSIVFPVIFKAIPEGALEQEDSTISRIILWAQNSMGIQKKKAWMNYAALVSLGGVIGPFLSSIIVYRIKALSKDRPAEANWIGLNCGILGQVGTSLALLVVLGTMEYFSAGMQVFLLFLAWGASIALNNVVTIYFNSHAQQRLGREQRGRFIANILMLFTLGNSAGTLVYGWALSGESDLSYQVSASARMILLATVLKIAVFVLLRLDTVGMQTVMLKANSE